MGKVRLYSFRCVATVTSWRPSVTRFFLCVKKSPSSFWPRPLFWTPPNPSLFEHFLNDLSPLWAKLHQPFSIGTRSLPQPSAL